MFEPLKILPRVQKRKFFCRVRNFIVIHTNSNQGRLFSVDQSGCSEQVVVYENMLFALFKTGAKLR